MNKKVLYLGLLAPIAVAPLAVVASCADTSNIGNKAFDNIQRSLDYWSRSQTLTLPTDIKNPFQIPTLKSTENFGFITNIPSVSNPDNAKGTIDVKVNIRRGPSENYEKTFTVGGFKTAKQNADETTGNTPVLGSSYFNEPADQDTPKGILKMNLVNKNANVDDVIKQVEETVNDDPKKDDKMEKLISLTGIKKIKTGNSNIFLDAQKPETDKVTEILKQNLKADEVLRLLDIKPTNDFGINSGIEARIQVVNTKDPNNELTSSVRVLLIEGFNVPMDRTFVDQFTNDYISGKILNEGKIDKNTRLIPFTIGKDKLETFLGGNGNAGTSGKQFKAATGLIKVDSEKRIKYELLGDDYIKGSEDKVSNSLRAKFKFSIEGQTDTDIEKEVTLYGFDFK